MIRLKSALRLCSVEQRIAPATFTVTNLSDSGPGSLRQAVLDANGNSGADSIQFNVGLTGILTLTSGELTVSDELTVSCPTHLAVRIQTNHTGRVFSSNTVLSLVNLEVSASSGANGGAVLSSGPLTITNCLFEANTATNGGAIYQTGPTLNITSSAFSDGANQGGAIWATGTVSVQYSQFDSCTMGNTSSGAGAGIYLSSGSLSLDSCSFRGCLATNLNFGKGGAVYCNGSFFAENCSFASGGGAQGGALYLTSGGTLWNCSVVYNVAGSGGSGGGIYGDVTLESTIVSNNNAAIGPDVFGAVTAKYCALGTSSGFTSFTDQGNNLAFGMNLQMGSDAFSHGGLVPTVALQYTSPCKDAGSNPGTALYDSRGPGLPRTVGSAPDIGAFEIQPPPKVTISINDGTSIQRSRVIQINITFDHNDILTSSGIKNACQLKRVTDNATVTLGPPPIPTPLQTLITHSYGFGFTAGPLNGISLADGVYQWTIFANQITDESGQHLDGNGDGIGGDDYVSPTTPGDPNRIFRLFGDADGNGIVDGMDFAAFRNSFNSNDLTFDFDGNGVVDGLDFGQFRQRFGMVI